MRTILISLCLVALIPVTARAQTDRHFALGAQVGFHKFNDEHFSKSSPSLSVLYRLSRNPENRKEGWVWRLGGTAGYSHAAFDTDLGGTDTKIGSLQTIPVVGGVERAYRHDRVKVGASVFAGPSFNDFSIDDAARTAYQNQNSVPLEGIEVKNSLAARTGLGMWYDMSSRIGLHAGAYYYYNRPKVTTTAGGVSTTETWKTDHVSLSTGFAIGIF